jgi:hypothetical protein
MGRLSIFDVLNCLSTTKKAADFSIAAAVGYPSILLVIADDWSSGHAGVFGCISIRNVARFPE